VGDGPCIRLLNNVIRCEAKYELTKKGLKEELFSETEVLAKKRVI